PNEIIAFDTDLVGSYGICVDISRTWWIGDLKPRPDMIDAMKTGIEHIQTNLEMIRPGLNIEDWIKRSHRLPEKYQALKYGCLAHGVGLCDEWPLVAYPDKMVSGAFDYELEPGMTLCVEALIAEEGGDFSIKLEDQVLVTESGFENLTQYPWDVALTGS
ncbi:MAG: M24 family metallopeptidase, partial [Pseudomonadota bacterium]